MESDPTPFAPLPPAIQAEAKLADGARKMLASRADTANYVEAFASPKFIEALASSAYRDFMDARMLFQTAEDAVGACGALAFAAEARMRVAHARVLERAFDSVFDECYKPAVTLLKAVQEEVDGGAECDGTRNMGIEIVLREAAAQRGALEARIAMLTAALPHRGVIKTWLGDTRDVFKAWLGWRHGIPKSAFGLMRKELRAATALREMEAALDVHLP